MTENKPKPFALAHIPPWEWAIAAVGLVLVLGVVGFLLYYAVTHGPLPPDITVEREEVHKTQTGYLVTLRVENHGGRAVAELTVEGELRNGEETVETSDVTLGFVPAGSERRAGLFFTKNPDEYDLRLRPKGYEGL